MNTTNSTTERVRAFVLEHFPLARKRATKDSDPLLDSGIIDSLGVLDIVSHLEKEFALTVADDELVPENFQTIDRIAAFVESKSARAR
jgi:acyl carrier protein